LPTPLKEISLRPENQNRLIANFDIFSTNRNSKQIHMSTLRFQALQDVNSRKPLVVDVAGDKISDFFGANVFNWKTMREYLPKDKYVLLRDSVEKGTRIDRSTADQVAAAMKAWAMQKGVTHYTHWFQPLPVQLPKNTMHFLNH
jgi:glutamine synthetase